jgi:putative ABC transport system permease protein
VTQRDLGIPVVATRLVSRCAPLRYRDSLLDDLDEDFGAVRQGRGVQAARRWYWAQAIAAVGMSWWQVLRLGTSLDIPSPRHDDWAFTWHYDVRVAVRSLVRAPRFAAMALVTFACGVGTTVAIFSVVNAVLLRPLPFRDPDRLVQLETIRGGERGKISLREIDDLRAQLTAAEEVAAYVPGSQYSMSGGFMLEKAPAILMTHNLPRVLGLPLLHGELFPASYDRERHNGLILSYGLWQRQFGGDPRIIGRSVVLDASPGLRPSYTVAGVMPEGVDFPARTDLYRSLFISESFPDDVHRDVRNAVGVARLKPRVSLATAREQLAAISDRLAAQHPGSNETVRLTATPLREVFTSAIRPHLWLLLCAAVTILVMAGVNVANLFLARSLERDQQLTIRRALGATRGQLVRGLVIEGVVLSLLGGAVGVCVAQVFLRSMVALVKFDVPSWMTITVDRPALAFALALSLVAGVVTMLVPALRATATTDAEGLRTGRGSSGARPRRTRHALLVSEVAVSVFLLVCAGLMLRTFQALSQSDVGFRSEGLLTFKVALPVYYTPAQSQQFQRALLARLDALPGVTGSAANGNLPLAQVGQAERESVVVEGQDASSAARNPYVNYERITGRYFEVMGIPIVTGGAFGHRDRESAPPAVVVSRRFAEHFWPNQDPMGKRLRKRDAASPWMVVDGVAGDVQHASLLAAPGLDVYLSAADFPEGWNHYVVRVTGGPPQRWADVVKHAVWAVNPEQPVGDVEPMPDRALDTAWPQRASAYVLGTFGLLALGLASVGIYGITSCSVGQRRRELGMRRALGATGGDLLLVIVKDTVAAATLGSALGLALGFVVAQAMRPLLYGVKPTDPLTFASAPLMLCLVGLFACLGPAWRAARVDPLVALAAD